ncbi:hypothetical protein K1719_031634 [Acacia pycnantha]|nr:hypothetical protein K1719_031634 [Acacia pycnantha]
MADSPRGSSTFWTQANALLRKNLTFQKRNVRSNVRLILFPFLICVLLVVLQGVINNELDKPKNKCGCICTKRDGDKCLEETCGIQYSDVDQVATCAIPNPPEWPPLIQVPSPEYRAVQTDIIPFSDLPNDSCRRTGLCPVTFLYTGNNQSFGETLFGNMFKSAFTVNTSDVVGSLARNVLGSASLPQTQNFLDPAFLSDLPIYYLQTQCTQNSSFSVPIQISTNTIQQEITCAQGLHLWRNNPSEVNNELFKGYRKGNPERQINEIVAAYDFLNSSKNSFNVITWYNSTYKNDTGFQQIALARVPRLVNLVSNAFLQFLQGSGKEPQNNDEDARSWRRAILDDNLWLFFFPLSALCAMLCVIRLPHRIEILYVE